MDFLKYILKNKYNFLNIKNIKFKIFKTYIKISINF